jgi:mannose-6-phosphate isomerase-like protein (cupin superfamily)
MSPDDAPVTSKVLHINKGHRFSLQYHDTKEEVLTLVEGECYIYLGESEDSVKKTKMEKGKGYLVKKNIVHRCEGITDCDIYESSTPEVGTTVRLEDDYSRGDETEEKRRDRDSDDVYVG